jgi:uncharacterized protein YgiM (DUF1202 family)
MNKYFWLIATCAVFSLSAEEAATINRARVNMRGGPSFASEVIGQLQKGDQVTFLEEVAVEKPRPGEPSKWAAIKLPASTPVWVFIDFLNDKTVKVPRLNLRAGPGENYSVVGRLQKGDTVKEIRTVEGWMQIETPENSRAFVDAAYVTRTNAPAATSIAEEKPKVFEPKTEPQPVITKPEQATPPPTVVAETPKPSEVPKPTKAEPEPKPAEKTVIKEEPKVVAAVPAKPEENKPPVAATESPKTESPKAEAPKVEEPKPVTKANPEPTAVATTTPPPPTTPAEKPPEVARPLPAIGRPILSRTNTVTVKRVVRREGEVRGTRFSIQAPTYFELVSAENGKVLNYLTAEKAGFKLKDYKGLRVIVTGEEMIEPRFPDKPLLEVETIEVAP